VETKVLELTYEETVSFSNQGIYYDERSAITTDMTKGRGLVDENCLQESVF